MPGGAPKGNLNALKHGFYSRTFKAQETDDLEGLVAGDLHDEIAMLRVAVRRVFSLWQKEDDPEKMMNALNVLGMASSRLAGLMRTQKLLGGEQDRATQEAIAGALRDLMEEFNIQ